MGDVVKLDYEATAPTQYRKATPRSGSGDASMRIARSGLRDWARYLEENDGTAIGILDALVNNVVGTGIDVEPMPLNRRGELHERTHRELSELWAEFRESPEVTGQFPGGEMDRLVCRSLMRDGEVFAVDRYGSNRVNRFGYAVRLREADFVPFDAERVEAPMVKQGVEMDVDGFVTAYHMHKAHPGDVWPTLADWNDLQRIPSHLVAHLKLVKRLSQTRGASVLHGVIGRLEDIKNTEDYERVAMQVAAAFTAAIVKSPELLDTYDDATQKADALSQMGRRQMEMAAGIIFDDLLPGEDIKGVGLDRPNTKLIEFIDQQLRPVAAGTGVSFSTAARKYDGTYSAQRQELVETRPNYLRLTEYFVSKFTRRLYRNFVQFIVDTGQYTPRGIDPATLTRAMFHGPGMVWIDPLKEAQADTERLGNKTMSRHQVIRDRGGNPAEVDAQIQADVFHVEQSEPEPQTEDIDDNDDTDER
jgi:lambda family phage portal protein